MTNFSLRPPVTVLFDTKIMIIGVPWADIWAKTCFGGDHFEFSILGGNRWNAVVVPQFLKSAHPKPPLMQMFMLLSGRAHLSKKICHISAPLDSKWSLCHESVTIVSPGDTSQLAETDLARAVVVKQLEGFHDRLPRVSRQIHVRHCRGRQAFNTRKIKRVYCHVVSTWNLDVVAYIIHTYINSDTQGQFMHIIAKISEDTVPKQYIPVCKIKFENNSNNKILVMF